MLSTLAPLILAVLLLVLLWWAASRLLAAFNAPAPLSTLVEVLIVVVGVVLVLRYVAAALGVGWP